MNSTKPNPHIGSDFESFLRSEGRLDEATALATKRVLAWELQRAMTLATISRAAAALGKSLQLRLSNAGAAK